MRNANERLQSEVLDELRWDSHVDVSAIGVAVAMASSASLATCHHGR